MELQMSDRPKWEERARESLDFRYFWRFENFPSSEMRRAMV
jgi:hypothetical protein